MKSSNDDNNGNKLRKNYLCTSIEKKSMSRVKNYLCITEIHIIHMIDTEKFNFHHYAKRIFVTADETKKRAVMVKGGRTLFTEKIRA